LSDLFSFSKESSSRFNLALSFWSDLFLGRPLDFTPLRRSVLAHPHRRFIAAPRALIENRILPAIERGLNSVDMHGLKDVADRAMNKRCGFEATGRGISRSSLLRRERNTLSRQQLPVEFRAMKTACARDFWFAGQYCSLELYLAGWGLWKRKYRLAAALHNDGQIDVDLALQDQWPFLW
jgi:hypothetical protein